MSKSHRIADGATRDCSWAEYCAGVRGVTEAVSSEKRGIGGQDITTVSRNWRSGNSVEDDKILTPDAQSREPLDEVSQLKHPSSGRLLPTERNIARLNSPTSRSHAKDRHVRLPPRVGQEPHRGAVLRATRR